MNLLYLVKGHTKNNNPGIGSSKDKFWDFCRCVFMLHMLWSVMNSIQRLRKCSSLSLSITIKVTSTVNVCRCRNMDGDLLGCRHKVLTVNAKSLALQSTTSRSEWFCIKIINQYIAVVYPALCLSQSICPAADIQETSIVRVLKVASITTATDTALAALLQYQTTTKQTYTSYIQSNISAKRHSIYH